MPGGCQASERPSRTWSAWAAESSPMARLIAMRSVPKAAPAADRSWTPGRPRDERRPPGCGTFVLGRASCRQHRGSAGGGSVSAGAVPRRSSSRRPATAHLACSVRFSPSVGDSPPEPSALLPALRACGDEGGAAASSSSAGGVSLRPKLGADLVLDVSGRFAWRRFQIRHRARCANAKGSSPIRRFSDSTSRRPRTVAASADRSAAAGPAPDLSRQHHQSKCTKQ